MAEHTLTLEFVADKPLGDTPMDWLDPLDKWGGVISMDTARPEWFAVTATVDADEPTEASALLSREVGRLATDSGFYVKLRP